MSWFGRQRGEEEKRGGYLLTHRPRGNTRPRKDGWEHQRWLALRLKGPQSLGYAPCAVVRIAPTINTPPCEAPMPFSICPYRHFPVQCPVTYNAGPILKQPLAYFLAFG